MSAADADRGEGERMTKLIIRFFESDWAFWIGAVLFITPWVIWAPIALLVEY